MLKNFSFDWYRKVGRVNYAELAFLVDRFSGPIERH